MNGAKRFVSLRVEPSLRHWSLRQNPPLFFFLHDTLGYDNASPHGFRLEMVNRFRGYNLNYETVLLCVWIIWILTVTLKRAIHTFLHAILTYSAVQLRRMWLSKVQQIIRSQRWIFLLRWINIFTVAHRRKTLADLLHLSTCTDLYVHRSESGRR